MSLGRTAVTALVLALASAGLVCGSAGLDADPEIREGIEQTVTAILKQDPEVPQRIEDLGKLARGDRRSLLLQVALYLRDSDSTEESMGGALLLHRLEFTNDEKLDAILPWLEDVGPELRRVFVDILGTIDRPEGGAPDFSFYEPRLIQERPRALILYMYEVSPAAALSSMRRAYGPPGGAAGRSDGAIHRLQQILADHLTPSTWTAESRNRAREILRRLSTDPEWWVRLYAAEILGRNEVLASPEIAGQLAADPDPLVRAAAAP